MSISRRTLLSALGVAPIIGLEPLPSVSDKEILENLFDSRGIFFDDPSVDKTKNAISVGVNGNSVTGVEGQLAVFVFNDKNQLSHIVLWKSGIDATGKQEEPAPLPCQDESINP